MKELAFRNYLRQLTITPDTVKRYVGDMVLIEQRMKEKNIGNGLDTTPLSILSMLIESRMADIVGVMNETSIQNYQTPGRHYVDFRRHISQQAQ